MFTHEHIEKSNEVLSPAYFYSRDAAERFMRDFEAEHFKPMLEKFVKEFHDELWPKLSEYLASDTTYNLHAQMWQQVDATVEALMSGHQWALDRYCLNCKYGNGEEIRKAVAAHVAKEHQDARVVDLEKQVATLKEELAFLRRVRG